MGACRVANSAVRYDLQLRGPRQTRRLRSAITARNRIDQAQGAESRPAVPPRDQRLTVSIALGRALSRIALPFALPEPVSRPRRRPPKRRHRTAEPVCLTRHRLRLALPWPPPRRRKTTQTRR